MNQFALQALAFLLGTTAIASAAPSPARVPELKTATGHPMEYYVVAPEGWTRERKWPVLVAVEAAEKEFKANAERFARASGSGPFVIVVPITVTNGNAGHRDPKVYPYSTATWDRIDKDGVCAFDEPGLAQVVKDVKTAYNGEDLVYLTGFEAGAHLLWATAFHHPEMLAAAAPVAGNFRNRCLEDGSVSPHASREKLEVRGFVSDNDKDFGPASMLFSQWKDARTVAEKNGYKNISEAIVKGKGHVPLPDEVIAYFTELRAKR
jgi:poly(3-hydroxybutyrate) depolymerase